MHHCTAAMHHYCTAAMHHSPAQITLYCIAESFDRKKLEELLKMTYSSGSVHSYPDVFYVDFVKSVDDEPGSGEHAAVYLSRA